MTTGEADGPGVLPDGDRLANRVRTADGLLLGLDFDGTLAPIVTDPDAAAMDPDVRDPLEDLAGRDDVRLAVISGRALADLDDRIDVDGVALAGNHGLELAGVDDGDRNGPAERHGASVEEARRRIAARVADVPGCRVEDKGVTLSVHVRRTPAARTADVRSTVRTVAEDLDLDVVEGKQVYEVRPPVDRDKGTAMDRLAETVPEDWQVMYVGDDETDEDAFRAIQPDGVAVHVGTDGETAADHRLPGQDDVAEFLRWLAEANRDAERAAPDGE